MQVEEKGKGKGGGADAEMQAAGDDGGALVLDAIKVCPIRPGGETDGVEA